MDAITLVIGAISIAACAVSAWLAYRIYAYVRLSSGWMAIVWAFVLMVVRRCVGFLSDFNMYEGMRSEILLFENLLQVVISLLFIWGFWTMLKNFQRFEVVEKQAAAKIKAFTSKRKR